MNAVVILGTVALVAFFVACLVAWQLEVHKSDGQTVGERRERGEDV